MSVKSEVAVRCEDERGREGLSRRQFFTGAGLLTGGAFAGSILAGCSPTKNAPMADQRYAQSYRPCDSYVRNMFGMQNMRDCLFVDPRGRDKSRACQKLCF